MSGHEQDTDLRDSNPDANGPDGAAGDMGVSSERVGHAGPGQVGTDGTRDDSVAQAPADAPPEQSAGGFEPEPDTDLPQVHGFPSLDPRSKDQPYKDA